MAQELSPELLNAVMQAESRGKRYDEKNRLLTSKKGAKGEMQVLDTTNLSPGFGVTPAKDKSPDERARVGRDYLAAMINRYPDRDTALMAYNWGPGNVDNWLKAGAPASKVPEETRNYVSKIDKMLTKDTQQAKAPAPATPDRATLEMNKAIDAGVSAQAPAAAPAQTVASRTAAYGPSYQAALAVSMLGDEDEKEDRDPDEPTVAEKFLAAPTAATSLANLDLSYASPFAEPEPVKMNKGGEVGPTPEEIEAASRPATVNPNIQRQGAAARQLASMRDVNTLPDPKTYATAAGLLGVAPDEQGFSVMNPQAAAIRSAGETGFYAGTALGVAPMAAALRGPAASLAKSEQSKQMLERLFPATQPMYAVKPRGGTFAYTPEDAELVKPVSKLAKVLRDYKVEATDLGASDEVQAFLNAKAPKYFTTVYGTADDPLRTAIAKKQITPFGSDAQSFRPYLIESASNPNAVGNLEARVDLEKAYDTRTGINISALRPEGATGFDTKLREALSEKIGQEGVPMEYRNIPSTTSVSPSQFESYPSSSEMLRKLVEREGKLPPNLQQALRTGEPMYDVNPQMALLQPVNVIEALQQVPANKLKNMSFPDALIKGTQELAPVRDYLQAVTLAEKGAKVPRKALDMFTSPVVEAPSSGGQWVKLDKPVATRMEGKLLNHSIGGYAEGESYGTAYTGLPYGGKKAFDEGLVQVYSLRDEQGLPKVTLEMAKSDAGKGKTWDVTQIRGRFNSEPPKEAWDDIFRLLDKIDSKDGLSRIKDNSYRKSPTGQDVDGTQVRWDREYDLYKQQSEK
jgi:hypothetical protein